MPDELRHAVLCNNPIGGYSELLRQGVGQEKSVWVFKIASIALRQYANKEVAFSLAESYGVTLHGCN
jgi:hypothetical protein